MSLDGFFLGSIVDELNKTILNCRIDKINQPEKDELILSFKGYKKSYKLLLSSSSNYPRIHLTKQIKKNPLKAPMFCMVLRKYLNNSTLTRISQYDNDRVVFLEFKSKDEFGFDSVYTLIVEIMGRHSNITLVRNRDNIIMDSIKHITPQINSYRSLYPGIDYINPPKSIKLNPYSFNFVEFKNMIIDNNIDFSEKMFSQVFTGVSYLFSKELFLRIKESGIELSIDSAKEICENLMSMFNSRDRLEYNFSSYSLEGKIKNFYCINMLSLKHLQKKEYTSPSELIEDFYFKKDKVDRLSSRSSDLQKIINNNIDRCSKKITILKETLISCEKKDRFKLYGELLTANIYSMKKGNSEIEVLNYYDENSESITIKLDINKTPSENVQYYYNKYNKLKRAESAANIQLEKAIEEKDYLESVLTNIQNAENYQEIEDVKRELIDQGYIKYKKPKKGEKSNQSKPLHFISSDNIDIFVGKNNIQNDYLSLKFASKHDTWLHTKNIPGSHVLIKHKGTVPNKTLEEAATLAAYYSKAKNSSNVPVDYTEVKNLRKPNGAKPGMVIYYTNKTIYVTPEKLDLTSSDKKL